MRNNVYNYIKIQHNIYNVIKAFRRKMDIVMTVISNNCFIELFYINIFIRDVD